MTATVKSLAGTFAVVTPELAVKLAPVSESIYQQLDQRFDGFRGHLLVAEHRFEADWGVWECHPAGDELVMLLSGEATLVLRVDGEEQALGLSRAGQYLVVPKNTWHTAHISCPTRMLFITPGEGTLNQEHPSD